MKNFFKKIINWIKSLFGGGDKCDITITEITKEK